MSTAAAAAAGAASGASGTSSSATAASIEEQYNKRLDGEMEALEDNFGYFVKATSLRYTHVDKLGQEKTEAKDKYRIAQERQLMEGAAANIIRSSETLLTMTAELRLSLLLNDFRTLNDTVRRRWLTLQKQKETSNTELYRLYQDLKDVTADLENSYYSSPVQ
ncbi:Mediator of RNA polymerase II transcription subunit 22 [Quaeritorhiza haematococci]|nr:Mediator of RNA polymerase II transcription subunit 22 [Quaeritorhiza haematococci]